MPACRTERLKIAWVEKQTERSPSADPHRPTAFAWSEPPPPSGPSRTGWWRPACSGRCWGAWGCPAAGSRGTLSLWRRGSASRCRAPPTPARRSDTTQTLAGGSLQRWRPGASVLALSLSVATSMQQQQQQQRIMAVSCDFVVVFYKITLFHISNWYMRHFITNINIEGPQRVYCSMLHKVTLQQPPEKFWTWYLVTLHEFLLYFFSNIITRIVHILPHYYFCYFMTTDWNWIRKMNDND